MNHHDHIQRILTTLLAVLFTALGLSFWIAPEQAGHLFRVEALGVSGLTTIRADFGGLFVGLAILCGIAAWTAGRAWALAAASVLGAVVVGRLLGWGFGGHVGIPELAVELGAIAVLAFSARRARAQPRVHGPTQRGKLWTALALMVLAPVGIFGALLHPGVEQRIFDRAAEGYAAKINRAPLVDDALRVAVCGSSAPLPSASRAKACVAVFAGGKFYVVDAGPESVENLVLWGVPLSAIGGVFLTHFHSDHIGDLGELQLQTWAGGRKEPLRVYGGPGVDRVVGGFNDAYDLDQGYRTTHHGEHVMPSAAWGMVARTVELDGPETPAKSRTGTALIEGALRVTAIEVDHAPITPAYAYRFDYKGRSVVITGDLKYHPPLAKAAAGTDILVSEAIATSMTKSLGRSARSAGRARTAAIMHDIEDYHITPEQAAKIANDAHVNLLVFYHLLPAADNFITRRLFAHGIDGVRRGDWTIAEDGSLYTLPIGSKDVRIGQVND